jgi:molybdate-binding protein/DNA-binding PadR family transcriptional regulator
LKDGEQHGYELRQALASVFGPEWQVDFGHLYRTLASLRRAGWIAERSAPSARGPRRRTYHLTTAGRTEFTRWLAAPAAIVRGRDELPVKLHFAARHAPARTPRLLDDRRRTLEAHHLQSDAAVGPATPHELGTWLAADTRRRQTQAALAALVPCVSTAHRAALPSALVAIGSDDPILNMLAGAMVADTESVPLATTAAGSLDGLLALRDGRADLAGVHLLDVDTGAYNLPFVKHLVPEDRIVLVELARREQGLMVVRGNPKEVRGVRDLRRRGVRLINRQRGAGTRLLLYARLHAERVSPDAVSGYDTQVPTHAAVAAAIAGGQADVGPGIRAVAERAGLDFIPLGFERYDLAVPYRIFNDARFRHVLDVLHDRHFRREAAALRGYDVSAMGRVVARLG